MRSRMAYPVAVTMKAEAMALRDKDVMNKLSSHPFSPMLFHMYRAKKICSFILAVAVLLVCLPQRVAAQADEGIRADLPLGGELRVENRRGSIQVEVWTEKHVSVSATVDGTPLTRSPVIIERTEALLSIGVARAAAGTKAPRIDLYLRIPERSRAELVTTSGEIEVRGLPAQLSARTVSGDILATLPNRSDAAVRAETTSGAIISALAAPDDVSSENVFEARMGAGSRALKLRTERGTIKLSPGDEPQTGAPTAAQVSDPVNNGNGTAGGGAGSDRRPPSLLGTSTGGGAGTPGKTSDEPFEVDENDVVRIDTELVTVNMSVIDRTTNRGIVNLTQREFNLFEDGVEQTISRFESSSAPFNLILLIDLSGSTREVVKLIREAALRFVDAARPMDSIGVVTFAGAPMVVSRPTNDRSTLRARINAIDTVPFGDTKLYDATDFTMKEFMKEVNNQRRTAIVLMSDGLDGSLPSVRGDGSILGYEDLLRRIQEFDGVVYSLWLNTEYESLSELDTQPEDFDRGHDRMREMAETGGGLFYEVEKIEDLAGTYERVVADLGTVYSISYRPTNKQRDGKWRSIRINVARQGAVARGKRGYYAN